MISKAYKICATSDLMIGALYLSLHTTIPLLQDDIKKSVHSAMNKTSNAIKKAGNKTADAMDTLKNKTESIMPKKGDDEAATTDKPTRYLLDLGLVSTTATDLEESSNP